MDYIYRQIIINKMNYLDQLESESIDILREVVGQFRTPALLFSGGKDSITLAHLCRKAFFPSKIPFPFVHIDTGHNFEETLLFRDELVERLGVKLLIGSVQESIDKGTAIETKGKHASRNAIQSVTLLETIERYKFDACIGGARRDEEKARAKERIFSVRNDFGQWDPKLQRPELWNLYNGMIHEGENVRVFPLSNWTELDVWNYIQREKIALPSLYFSHHRNCVWRNNQWLFAHQSLSVDEKDLLACKQVRFRTIGDITCTAAVESTQTSIEGIIEELVNSKTSERGARLDDKLSEAAMEDRKVNGYF